jgi:hypothetical protein
VRSEIEEKEPWSESMGLVHSRVELYATDGEDDDPFAQENLVMSYVALGLFDREDD